MMTDGCDNTLETNYVFRAKVSINNGQVNACTKITMDAHFQRVFLSVSF